MTTETAKTPPQAEMLASRFPTAYTILFLLIVLVAALTWIIPAGQYDREMNEAVGREVAVAGTYKTIDANPQGFIDVLLAPTAGFYDPDSYAANAIDVALFVLFLGGFLGVVNATGAIDVGIRAAMRKMTGREVWMIPILMSLFALGGTTYGMAEETLAFYALLIPVMMVAGFDALTGVAIILIGAGIGTLGSTINPFRHCHRVERCRCGVYRWSGGAPGAAVRRAGDLCRLRHALCDPGEGRSGPLDRRGSGRR